MVCRASPVMLELKCAEIRIDGEVRSVWDFLLRIGSSFAIEVSGRSIYSDDDFCVVELGVELARWLSSGPSICGDVIYTPSADFVYTSMESEVEGLVRFTRVTGDRWRISAAHQDDSDEHVVADDEVRRASRVYVAELLRQLESRQDAVFGASDPHDRRWIQTLMLELSHAAVI